MAGHPHPMTFDFDNPPARQGTDSQKWQKYEGRDVLPLWVADMDFVSPPPLIEALHRRVDHGIFGYARPTRTTNDAIVAAMAERYGWNIDPAWITWMPGLVVTKNVLSRAFAEAGEEVLTLAPVYPPFFSAPRNAGRKTVPVDFKLAGNGGAARWEIDWDALERAVTPATRMFFLCNPHNPLARVWRREELVRLGEFCSRHNLIISSDEIHCDLILDPALRHVATATLSPEIAARTITLMAPSKTYNIPGFSTSIVIISDAALRARFRKASAGIVAEVTALGFTACESAYRDCEPWRQELLAYLRGNRDRLTSHFAAAGSRLRIEAPIEATYLAWLDARSLGLSDPVAHFESFGVGLSNGTDFGAPRGHYVRLNFGCPRRTLDEALRRIDRALA